MKKIQGLYSVENSIRDFINWLAVFKTEYGIEQEAYEMLHKKADELAIAIGAIRCDATGKVDAKYVKTSANTLRDAKAWLGVFAKEYNIEKEAVKILTGKFDEIGKRLALLDCR